MSICFVVYGIARYRKFESLHICLVLKRLILWNPIFYFIVRVFFYNYNFVYFNIIKVYNNVMIQYFFTYFN